MRIRNSLEDKVFDTFNIIICTLIFIATCYPFYYILVYSISDPSLVYKGAYLHPQGFSLFVFEKLITIKGLPLSFGISALRTVTGTVAAVFSNSLLAYIFTRKDFRLRKALYRFVVITMYFNAGLIPTYLVTRGVGLKDSFLVYIIPTMMNAFYIVLIKTFIEQLPPSIEESAKMDGAGAFTIYLRIILPTMLPIIATISIFTAVGQWNSWFDTLIYISNDRLFTAQYILYTYLTQANSVASALNSNNNYANAGIAAKQISPIVLRYAITIVVLVPVMAVYPFMQKFFVKGIALGAIKG